MKYYLDLDMEKCSACGACAVACMDQNDINPRVRAPFRNVFSVDKLEDGTLKPAYASLACMHCADAPCIPACPSACLKKDESTGFTIYDNENCIGCHSCAMACPFGVPTFNEADKMEKCDGCAVRVTHGMEPACARVCPTGALKLYTQVEYENAHLDKSVHKLLKLI